MSSFIVIPDPHLGKTGQLGKAVIGTNINSRILDQMHLLDWCLEQAISKNVTDIILAGDIFDDPKPSTSIITIFMSWLKRCQLHNMKIHIVVGNHDIVRSGTSYGSPLDVIEEADLENVYVYKTINTSIFDGFAITLIPFRDRKSFLVDSNEAAVDQLKQQLIYEIAGIPSTYKKIAIGHLSLLGSIYVGDEVDDLSNELMCPLDLFEGYDYVWMGHVHKPQIMNEVPHIAHIGSLDISDFGETDHKKNIVIYDHGTSNKFEYQTIPTRKLNKITIDVPNDIEDIDSFVISEIENKKIELKKSIIKLEINLENKDKSINKNTLTKFLNKNGVFNISGIIESKKSISLKKENNKINNKMDVLSAIKQYAESYIKDSDKSKYIKTAIDIYNQFQEEAK